MQRLTPDQFDEPNFAVPERRVDNLALAYQELFTVIVRLRTGRYPVHDPAPFRAQITAGLKTAQTEARSKGYSDEDVKVTSFAVVGFLDESILNHNPDFADWIQRPLQQEMFGTMTAGEIFFRNIDYLLNRSDSQDLADVLEVYELCLLLGFRGRFGKHESASLRAIAATLDERIRRIRAGSWPAVLRWRPEQVRISRKNYTVRRLSWAAVLIWLLAIGLFVTYFVLLRSTASQVLAAVPATRS